MDNKSRFIVLIERRTVLAGLLALALSAAVVAPRFAHAATLSSKIAADLKVVINASTTPVLSWTKDLGGVRYVKALIVSSSDDPELADLRNTVLANGGSVYFSYTSVRALSVMVPASKVNLLAARADVQGISPNRMTARTASTLEATTGTMNVRTLTFGRSTVTMDGSGVAIAVLEIVESLTRLVSRIAGELDEK